MSKEIIEKALKTWLSISDMIPFDVIMATALAAMFPGDSVWLFVQSKIASDDSILQGRLTTSA